MTVFEDKIMKPINQTKFIMEIPTGWAICEPQMDGVSRIVDTCKGEREARRKLTAMLEQGKGTSQNSVH